MDSLGFCFVLCSCCLETLLFVAQTHFKLNPPASALWVLGLRICVSTSRRVSFFVARLQAQLLLLDLIPTGAAEILCGGPWHTQMGHTTEDSEAVRLKHHSLEPFLCGMLGKVCLASISLWRSPFLTLPCQAGNLLALTLLAEVCRRHGY